MLWLAPITRVVGCGLKSIHFGFVSACTLVLVPFRPRFIKGPTKTLPHGGCFDSVLFSLETIVVLEIGGELSVDFMISVSTYILLDDETARQTQSDLIHFCGFVRFTRADSQVPVCPAARMQHLPDGSGACCISLRLQRSLHQICAPRSLKYRIDTWTLQRALRGAPRRSRCTLDSTSFSWAAIALFVWPWQGLHHEAQHSERHR